MLWMVAMSLIMTLGEIQTTDLYTYRTPDEIHSDEWHLKRYLLERQGYDSNVRPISNWSNPIVTTFNVAINQIIDVDARHQVLHTSLGLQMSWIDEYLRWNASLFGGLQELRLPASKVWRPDITFYSETHQNKYDTTRYNVLVTSEGVVSYLFPFVAKTSCQMNVAFFPFDEQSCVLKFGSWTYDVLQLDIRNKYPQGDTGKLVSNGEWDLLDFRASKHVVNYNCCPEPYSDVRFVLNLKRRPLYYIFNLVLPCALIVGITILGFYLPPSSGEKVSLGVTTLLTLTVFLLLVADHTPPQSEVIPLISVYFALAILEVSLSTMCTVFVVGQHHKGQYGSKVPKLLKKIVLVWIGRLVCYSEVVKTRVKRSSSNIVSSVRDGCAHSAWRSQTQCSKSHHHPRNPSSVNCAMGLDSPVFFRKSTSLTNKLLSQMLYILQDVEAKLHDNAKAQLLKTEWQLVAVVIDRLFLWVYLISTILITILIFAHVL